MKVPSPQSDRTSTRYTESHHLPHHHQVYVCAHQTVYSKDRSIRLYQQTTSKDRADGTVP